PVITSPRPAEPTTANTGETTLSPHGSQVEVIRRTRSIGSGVRASRVGDVRRLCPGPAVVVVVPGGAGGLTHLDRVGDPFPDLPRDVADRPRNSAGNGPDTRGRGFGEFLDGVLVTFDPADHSRPPRYVPRGRAYPHPSRPVSPMRARSPPGFRVRQPPCSAAGRT